MSCKISCYCGSLVLSVTLMLLAQIAHAQSCSGFRIRFGIEVSSGWSHIGPWASFANESQRMAAAIQACEAFATVAGPIAAAERFPAPQWTSNGYQDVFTDGSGCSFKLWGLHPVYGMQIVGPMGGGNEVQGGICIPLNSLRIPGPSCSTAGNPIDLATGNKYQLETDYRSADGTLEFSRHYNSLLAQPPVASPYVSALGSHWRSTYDRAIRLGQIAHPLVYVYRPDGKTFTFSASGNNFITDPDINDRLEKRVDAANVFIGWRYTVGESDDVEIYDVDGKLLTITSRAGVTITLTYDGLGRLSTVTDPFGKGLSFSYDGSSRLSTLTVPGGQTYTYAYHANNNVSSVALPDGTARSYAYNESTYTAGASLPTVLTGLFDESSTRYSTFRYNASQLAVSTEHAGGVGKYEIQYSSAPTPNAATFIDPLGQSRTLTLATIQGVVRVNGSTAKSDLACTRHQSAQRDANGHVTLSVDFKGIQTRYQVDTTRNLETFRSEATNTTVYRNFWTHYLHGFFIYRVVTDIRRNVAFNHLSTRDKNRSLEITASREKPANRASVSTVSCV